MKLTKEHEKKVYSQNGEDGIIETIFEEIGVNSMRFLEIGIEDGKECNTRNLVEDYGWVGTMVEGNKREARKAYSLFRGENVSIVSKIVTPENINQLICSDLDLLSIDVDGDDYWIWKAVKYSPRVVIIEYNSTYGNKPITQPYLGKMRTEKHPDWLYHGAGLNALITLGKAKGYNLVYANGINAFFVYEPIEEFTNIEELTFEEAYQENLGRRKWGTPEQQFELIKDREFMEIMEI
jgi:hypothetical protein